jgi:hypothetical protein
MAHTKPWAAVALLLLMGTALPLSFASRLGALRRAGPHSDAPSRKLIDDVDGQECFTDGDNFAADPGNTDRGDWGKCIPVPIYGVVSDPCSNMHNNKL